MTSAVLPPPVSTGVAGHALQPTGAASSRTAKRLIALSLLVTLGFGVWMRLALTGSVSMGLDFAHLRHAHSHLGAYGVLFPLAFLAWQARGAPTPGPRAMTVYALATALAVVGFLRAGYGPEAIVGSTVVGGLWLWSAFRLRRFVLRLDAPLALVPPGIVAAMACVPFIALTLRKDPVFAHQLVATFLSTLLLVVITPSALAAIGARAWASPALAVAGLLGTASLGVWSAPASRLGLAVYGLWLASVALQRSLAPVLRAAWGAVGLGLLSMAVELVPNQRPAVLGALHFLVLGPVLLSLLPTLWRAPPRWAQWVLLGFVALAAAPLVAQSLGVYASTLQLSALGGALVLGWWLAVLRR
ncbi:MAG: hypothetical protein IAE78_11310 [Myxococcus sp.]|nr:hypothetical protein [Myxococcus sp.]